MGPIDLFWFKSVQQTNHLTFENTDSWVSLQVEWT